MTLFATQLFREVRPDFFRVLAGPLARLYVDTLDALERETGQRNQGLDRAEALALVEQVVEQHGDLADATDELVAVTATNRERARLVLDTLRMAGWLQEEERSDWQKLIFFDPSGVVLLHALRRIAFPEAAVFSDKLVNVCATLSRGGEVNLDALYEDPWAQVETCVANLQAGLTELRGMQKSIERHTKQQLAATSLKENLALLYDQFAERIGRTCYAQLVHSRLPSKLSETRRALESLSSHIDLMTKMQSEVMRRDPALSPEAAMARVRLRINELEEMLQQIEPLADMIDRRTAEFARRSQARFRYLQETASENRARVQTFFETLNQYFSGWRMADIEASGIEIPALTVHDVRIPGGLESLYTPRLRRIAGEIEPLEDVDPRHADHALAQLETLPALNTAAQNAAAAASRAAGQTIKRLGEIRQGLGQLRDEIAALKIGKLPFPTRLLDALNNSLLARGADLPARHLRELCEVTDERWRPAIEVAFARKFAVVVAVEHYEQAEQIYHSLKPSELGSEASRESLVNPTKALQRQKPVRPGSLAEKLRTSHPVAEAIIGEAFGNLMCVERREALRDHDFAILPDGFMARGAFVERSRFYDGNPFVGQRGLEQQRAWKEKQAEDLANEERKLSPVERALKSLNDGWREHFEIAPSLYQDLARAQELPKLQDELKENIAKLNRIDRST